MNNWMMAGRGSEEATLRAQLTAAEAIAELHLCTCEREQVTAPHEENCVLGRLIAVRAEAQQLREERDLAQGAEDAIRFRLTNTEAENARLRAQHAQAVAALERIAKWQIGEQQPMTIAAVLLARWDDDALALLRGTEAGAMAPEA